MPRKKFLIVTAGGHGVRMGGSLTVLPKEHFQTWKHYCETHNFHYPQTLVSGGITRFHSVKNALSKVPDGALVAVHDGVRPFISKELIEKMFQRMDEVRALIPVLPSTDTLKVLDRNRETGVLSTTEETLDRSRIFGAQTPQIFYSEDLKEAYSEPFDPLFTDDASVAQRHKIPLSYIEGERFNIKITTPEDLALAGMILKLS